MVGKWHLGVGVDGEFLPTRQGFSEYFGLPYSHDMCPFGPSYCYPGRDCDSISPHPFTSPCPLYSGEQIVEQPVNLSNLHTRMTERATTFITDSLQSHLPFYLYFSFNHVHFPQFAGPEFHNTSRAGTYGDSVAEMDATVGNILDTLRQSGWGIFNSSIFYRYIQVIAKTSDVLMD